MSLENIPNNPLLLILRFIGRPSDFLCVLSVCHSWRDRIDEKDVELWHALSVDYGIAIHSLEVKRTLRCTTNYRKAFFTAYFKKQREMYDKHELLIVHAKTLLQGNRDHPKKLDKMICNSFDDMRFFDSNYRGKTMEDNTLLTLSCRYSHFNCMKLLIDRYNADINIPDMGGFTPLILCAYHGNFDGVLYLLSRKADYRAVGRLRSGPRLTAEHWAAIQGNMLIFRYLHALRRRFICENTDNTVMNSSIKDESVSGAVPVVVVSAPPVPPKLAVPEPVTPIDVLSTDVAATLCTAVTTTTTTTTTTTSVRQPIKVVQLEPLSNLLAKSESLCDANTAHTELLSIPGRSQCVRPNMKLPSFAAFLDIITTTDDSRTNPFLSSSSGSSSSSSSKMLSYRNVDQKSSNIAAEAAPSRSSMSTGNPHCRISSSNSNSDSSAATTQSSDISSLNQHSTSASSQTDCNIMRSKSPTTSSGILTLSHTDSETLSINPDGVLAGPTDNNNPDWVLAGPTDNNIPDGVLGSPTDNNIPDGVLGSPAASNTDNNNVSEEADRQQQRFCMCKRGFEGQMSACDGPQCRFEWFHYACVGLHARVRPQFITR